MQEQLQWQQEFQPIPEHTFNHRAIVAVGSKNKIAREMKLRLLAELREKTGNQIPILFVDINDSKPYEYIPDVQTIINANRHVNPYVRDIYFQTKQGLCVLDSANSATHQVGKEIAQFVDAQYFFVENLDGGNMIASKRGLFCVGNPDSLPNSMGEYTQLDSSRVWEKPTIYHTDVTIGFLWNGTREFAVVASTQEALNLSSSNTGNPYVVKHGRDVFIDHCYTDILVQFELEVLATLKNAGYTDDDIIPVPALLYPTNKTFKGNISTTLLYSPANLLQYNTPEKRFALLPGGIPCIDDIATQRITERTGITAISLASALPYAYCMAGMHCLGISLV